MKTEVYTCDICKQSKSVESLCAMDITTRGVRIVKNTFGASRHFDICRDCLEKRGFVIDKSEHSNDELTINKNAKTLETKLLDILEDLGVAFIE